MTPCRVCHRQPAKSTNKVGAGPTGWSVRETFAQPYQTHQKMSGFSRTCSLDPHRHHFAETTSHKGKLLEIIPQAFYRTTANLRFHYRPVRVVLVPRSDLHIPLHNRNSTSIHATTANMSYNKPEKDFGDAPVRHARSIPLSCQSPEEYSR